LSVEERLARIEAKLEGLGKDIDWIKGQVIGLLNQPSTVDKLIKYVITPLIIALAALMGIKLVLPE